MMTAVAWRSPRRLWSGSSRKYSAGGVRPADRSGALKSFFILAPMVLFYAQWFTGYVIGPRTARHWFSMLAEQLETITDALLIALAEARGRYTYDTILVKRSILGASQSGPCETCEDNEEAGWIDSEDVYPSGEDGPPFHPHCVCSEEYKEKRVRVYM